MTAPPAERCRIRSSISSGFLIRSSPGWARGRGTLDAAGANAVTVGFVLAAISCYYYLGVLASFSNLNDARLSTF